MERISQWCRNHREQIILFIFIFLVSTVSFGLGYLTAIQGNRAPIIIEKVGK